MVVVKGGRDAEKVISVPITIRDGAVEVSRKDLWGVQYSYRGIYGGFTIHDEIRQEKT